MEKKQYNAPAIDIVRVQTESLLAAESVIIGPGEATEPAGSKGNDLFDDEDTDW